MHKKRSSMNFTFEVRSNFDAELKELNNRMAEKIKELESLVSEAREKLFIPLRLDLNDEEFEAFIAERNRQRRENNL